MIGVDEIAQAVRDQDAAVDDGGGFADVFADRGVDAEGATYIATPLDEGQRRRVAIYGAVWLDAFAAGLTVENRRDTP